MIVTVSMDAADLGSLRRIADRLAGRIAPFAVQDSGTDEADGLWAHGCDLLADNADWDAPTWEMTSEAIGELQDAWRKVFAEATGTVTVTAIWSDDKVDMETRLTRTEFLELTAAGRIGTRTRYTIAPARDVFDSLR